MRKLLFSCFVVFASSGCQPSCHLPDRPSGASSFRALWLGDTLLADAAEPTLASNGYDHALAALEGTWDADWVFLNAEGPFTTRTESMDPNQRWSYNAQPEAATALARYGVDAASLANNHGMDRDVEGLEDSITHLLANGISPFGAGSSIDEAREPIWLDTPDGSWAVFAFSAAEPLSRRAGSGSGGVLPLERGEAARAIALAEDLGADFAAAFVHWGNNYSEVTSRQREQAAMLSDEGFDLAIGHGPHVEQPLEEVCGMPVAWSLGNFAFGTPGRFTDEFPGYGLALHTQMGREGVHAIEVRCLRTDNREVNFQPRLCNGEEAGVVLDRLHPDLERNGEVGVWWL